MNVDYFGIFKKESWTNLYDYDEEIVKKVWEFFINEIPKIGFESREGQEDMSLDICEAIRDDEHIMIEAGVGIGKSYAYLVPLLYYNNLINLPVIISTSTILLQEQLIKDIKKISERVHIYPNVVLAKGMSHFKCSERALKYIKNNYVIEELKEWIEDTSCGDRSLLPEPVKDVVWNKINVDNCKGSTCNMYHECYYMKRRDDMLNSKGIILCNHDLLAVDLQRKERGQREILSKKTKIIVIDEAHNLEDKVRNSLKESYKYKNLINQIEEAITFASKSPNENEINNTTPDLIENIYNEFLEQVIRQNKKLEFDGGDIARYYVNVDNIRHNIQNVIKNINNLNIKVQLTNTIRLEDKQEAIIESLENIIDFFNNLINKDSNCLFWMEISDKEPNIDSIVVFKCPKSLDKLINKMFFYKDKPKTILTSATLTSCSSGNIEEKYKYITNAIGYPVGRKATLSEPKESPYKYNENSIIYYREDMPHPIKERELFIDNSVDVITHLMNLTRGKTMILFTAKSDMLAVYNKLKSRKIMWNIIMQQDGASQEKIIKEFKSNINSVLLGTGSYWEGISIEGKALSSLIIFRLPFPVPDPIIDYKKTLVNNPLMEVDVPEMIIRLRQGVGRLIRNTTDKGIVTILDSRISDKSQLPYKNEIWNSLPMKVRSNDIGIIKKFINEKIL